MKIEKREYKMLLGLVLIGVVFSWLLNNSGIKPSFFVTVLGLFYPFLLGLAFAYLFNIPMSLLEKHVYARFTPRVRRRLSFFTTLLALLLVLALAVGLIIPALVQSVLSLAAAMPGYITSAKSFLLPYTAHIPMLQDWLKGLNIDWAGLGKQAAGVLQTGSTAFINSVFGIAGSIISGTLNFIIAVFFAVPLLFQKEKQLGRVQYFLQSFIPQQRYASFMYVARLANHKFSRFVTAECVEAVVLGVLYFVVFLIGGFKYPLLIGVVAGLLSLVPLFGGYIGLVLCGFLTLVSSGGGRFVAFVIIYLLLQRIEGNILFKRIVGGSIGLTSTWMLVAVTLGGGLFGIPGVLFFVPLTSLVYTLMVRQARKKREEKALPLLEEDSLPEEEPSLWKRLRGGQHKGE